MPSSAVKKAVAAGAAGVTVAGIAAWRTQFPWIKYDLQLMKAGMKTQKASEEAMTTFIIDKFEAIVVQDPQRMMLIFEDMLFTYHFVDQQANRVASIMRQMGLGLGDTVALVAHNEPAFVWTFLGLQKLGITAALINCNLRHKQLAFSIQAGEPKALIVGSGEDLLHAVLDVLGEFPGLPVLVQGLSAGSTLQGGLQDMDTLTRHALPVRPDPVVRSEMTDASIGAYIYTSGTTGFPKPALISQSKLKSLSILMQLYDTGPGDVVYTVIPLYHMVAFGIGFMGILAKGATMLLRKKFSASHFWSDCRRHKVTIIQYIGELFRYLVAQPKHELDSVHSVRAAIGNGLRKDIFQEVQERFKIPNICEFFGATEGVSGLMNVAGKPGAIGRLSPFLTMLAPFPSVLVKFDYSSAVPIRDKNGRCIKVKLGEPGLFLSQVPDHLNVGNSLTVYKASKEANEKKLARNVFKEGDLYFNYGDVFYMDSDYFVYFHDRIGDTFRWKGENVSTTEVANILSAPVFIHDANVYGVTVPGHDGRACMAALTLEEGETITPKQLMQVYKVCKDDLPSYARPLFLRILPESLLTGTFKQRKTDLMEEGYDLNKVKDALYYLNSQAQTYSPLTLEVLGALLQSKL